MEEQIKWIIKDEVMKHNFFMDEYHVETIVNALYDELLEYIPLENLVDLIGSMKGEFLKIDDSLIPIVEEYETKIDAILENQMSKFFQSQKDFELNI